MAILRRGVRFAVVATIGILVCTAGAQAQTLLIDCSHPTPRSGDQLTRGFYVTDYPGGSLARVDLWLSSATKGDFQVSLTARANAYNGPLIGQSVKSFSTSGSPDLPTEVHFTFPSPAVQPNSTVTFALAFISGPGTLFYSVETTGGCPVIETEGTTPPLDTIRRNGITVRIWGGLPPVPVPGQLHVADADRSPIYFWCQDPVHPPQPAGREYTMFWGKVLYSGRPADAYHSQIFQGSQCLSTPWRDHFWQVPGGNDYYGETVLLSQPALYCYRVRAWVNAIERYSDFSGCCCFEAVVCTTLPGPTVTGVGGAACGGTTSQPSPPLAWQDVAGETGYRWEVRLATGAVVRSGTTGQNVTTASIGPLSPGAYLATVQAVGDGVTSCDGPWSQPCEFQVVPACTTLPAPVVVSVAGAACGGTTTQRTPKLVWQDVANERGYLVRVRTADGKPVSTFSVGANVTSADLGPLSPGRYTAGVQALGDGERYCDSSWSSSCAFTVAEVQESAKFSWWPVQPKQGGRVRFADLSTGVPRSWLWSFGDGSTSGEQNPTHVFQQGGTFDVSLQVQFDSGAKTAQHTLAVVGVVRCGDTVCEGKETAWSCPSDCALKDEETGRAGGSDRRSIVPAAVGGVEGVLGTFWMTEGMVSFPSVAAGKADQPAQIMLEYTPRGGSTVLTAGPFELPPDQSMYWENIVDDLFSTKGNGALWLDSDQPVLFLTRSYNATPDGSYGQNVSGIGERLTLGTGDGKVYLIGLREDSDFRSNLFFQEVDGLPVTVELEVLDDAGETVHLSSFPVDGHSQKMRSLQGLGLAGVESAYAKVQVVGGGGRLAVIGSVVDNITGDPTTIDGVHTEQVTAKSAVESHHLVAVVAHTQGYADSVWRSQVEVVNSAAAPQTVRFVYDAEYDRTGAIGDTRERTVTIEPGEQLVWRDVVVDLFGAPAGAMTQGALHVHSPLGVVSQSRTYNQRTDGATLGQGLPALGAGDMIYQGETGVIAGLRHTADTRTNLGLAEFSGLDTQVSVTFFSTQGGFQLLGALVETVPASSHLQITKVFERLGLGSDPVSAISAYVRVVSGGSVYAYASTVDNGTGDGTTYLGTTR